jgi:2-C-methyl-D-erythritol 2,4-cyclodiphosphate synthase
MRIGIGYDVHRLVAGRRLVLGGVDIPFGLGLLGHSDADVLTHAIMDALLGAAGLNDIGHHFPPDDPQYKDIPSLLLLERVEKLVTEKGLLVCNVDATVVAQRPRIAPYVGTMRSLLSGALRISAARVSVKATTSEGLGFAGRGEGMAALATALLEETR